MFVKSAKLNGWFSGSIGGMSDRAFELEVQWKDLLLVVLMQTLTLQDAQRRLPELIAAAVSGEEVTIESNDGTIVALMLLKPMSPKPIFGSAKGLIKILDGFDDPIEGFEDYEPRKFFYILMLFSTSLQAVRN